MKGCLGCLGLLLLLALLAWPIEVLAQLLGWSDATTGSVILLVLGLLAIGAAGRREASRTASETACGRVDSARQRRLGHPAVGQLEAQAGVAGRPVDRAGRWPGRRSAQGPRPGAFAARALSERNPRPRARHPARVGGEGVGRARDPLPAQLRFRVLERDGFRCRYCGRTGSDPGVVLHVDHVVPLAAGGDTSERNLRTACEECNLGKAARAGVAVGP